MEKSQKGTSSVNPKEKKSFLDEDIGKDFLSSWKSMAVTEDDAMDFGFNMASSSKNKTFDFDKLEMDFGLDGDFDKLSSFKVDMSDFDLSAPSKKAAKPKEVSEDESSTGKPQEKKSQFNFSFDFNELDNFNFESSSVKEEKVSSKNKNDQMKISSDGTEQKSSKIQLSEDTSAFDDTIAMKLLPASKGVATSNVKTLLSGPRDHNAMEPDCAKYLSSEAPNSSSNFRSSPEEAISSKSTDQQSHMSEKAIGIDTCTQQATFEFPDQSLVGVDSNRNSLSDGQTKTNYQGTGVNVTSSRKKDIIEKITGLSSCHKTLQLKNSFPPSIIASGSNSDGKIKSDTEITTETLDDNESATRDLHIAENSSGSLKASHDIKDNKENQHFATELPVDPYSEPLAGISTIANAKEAGAHQLKFSKREGSALEAKSLSSGSERTGFMHKSPAIEIGMGLNSDDGQRGIKSGGNPVPAARELMKGEDALLMGAKNVKHPNNIREGFTSDGLPNISKLAGNSCLNDTEVENRKPVMSTSENTVKVQNTMRFLGSSSLTQNQDKSDTQTCLNPKTLVSSLESVRMPKIKSVEWNKLSLVRSPKKISDQSILNISLTKGAGKVSYSTQQKDINSLQCPNHDMEVQDTAASETAYPHNSTEKQLPHSFSLKRKAFELPNADLACLKPLKRLSSPSENRGLREPPKQSVEEKLSRVEKSLKPLSYVSRAPDGRDLKEPSKRVDVKESMRRIEEEKVCSHEDQEESSTKSILFGVPASKIEIPREANVMDLELSSTIESDGNVEKAEAFAKELEDICNMLRKKHKEAKEILVRALVNNNNLLMLNHPIYEEKICKVQRFAAGLMSKELKT